MKDNSNQLGWIFGIVCLLPFGMFAFIARDQARQIEAIKPFLHQWDDTRSEVISSALNGKVIYFEEKSDPILKDELAAWCSQPGITAKVTQTRTKATMLVRLWQDKERVHALIWSQFTPLDMISPLWIKWEGVSPSNKEYDALRDLLPGERRDLPAAYYKTGLAEDISGEFNDPTSKLKIELALVDAISHHSLDQSSRLPKP